ncbi:hypothetical protein [Paenibacillus naphthalenovorans]|uniref:restriction endonuclease-related protein n=1 Tax=Paenibacillus naphthalenovorans TaxID=162209 RepID=UPI0008900B71|nr:hypothetical protein [Paenibacillus naphthalenovorans]SDJ83697.1 hypothetical protein SAMN05421868_1485 [Paenibacillus naphthalenovorans]
MQIDKNDVRDCLLNLIAGLEQWGEDFSEMPTLLRKGHMQFVRLLMLQGIDAPIDLPPLIQYLQKPAVEWGIPVDDIFPLEAPLLIPYLGLSPAAREFIFLYDSPEEAQAQEMLEILHYCRGTVPMLEEKYRKVREFIIMNPVVSAYRLMEFGLELQDTELMKRLSRCYEDITDDLDRFRCCPRCGWTLEYRNDHWQCGTEDLCGKLESRGELKRWETIEPLQRLRYGIFRYTMLPGLAELAAKDWLAKEGYKVTLFPQVDRFDLAIQLDSHSVYLDMKDFKHPLHLANFFNKMQPHQLEKYREPHVYIVIPQYRNKLYPGYARLVTQALASHASHLQVINEKDILRVLEREAMNE